jgi:hypothetical protein
VKGQVGGDEGGSFSFVFGSCSIDAARHQDEEEGEQEEEDEEGSWRPRPV